MAESETEIFCDLDQKNLKRKSYKQARVSFKSVLNSEKDDELHINSVEFQRNWSSSNKYKLTSLIYCNLTMKDVGGKHWW